MAEQASFAEGHEHSGECLALYPEWKKYHAIAIDTSGRYDRDTVLSSMREREMFERQMRLLGCSGEAVRRVERDAEIATHGHPLL